MQFHISNKIIVESAKQKNGVFSKTHYSKLQINRLSKEQNFLLYDGHFLYPIFIHNSTKLKKQVKQFDGIIGIKKYVEDILKLYNQNNFFVIQKDFCILTKKLKDKIDVFSPLSIKIVNSKKDLNEFSLLKSQFLFEESNIEIDVETIVNDIKSYYRSLKPVLLKYDNKTIGMISSNFHYSKSAMLNMLYIKKEFRKKGYGELLSKWYIKYLQRSSKNICLFVSSENIQAKKIYSKMGFRKVDNWLMALSK